MGELVYASVFLTVAGFAVLIDVYTDLKTTLKKIKPPVLGGDKLDKHINVYSVYYEIDDIPFKLGLGLVLIFVGCLLAILVVKG